MYALFFCIEAKWNYWYLVTKIKPVPTRAKENIN